MLLQRPANRLAVPANTAINAPEAVRGIQALLLVRQLAAAVLKNIHVHGQAVFMPHLMLAAQVAVLAVKRRNINAQEPALFITQAVIATQVAANVVW